MSLVADGKKSCSSWSAGGRWFHCRRCCSFSSRGRNGIEDPAVYADSFKRGIYSMCRCHGWKLALLVVEMDGSGLAGIGSCSTLAQSTRSHRLEKVKATVGRGSVSLVAIQRF